MSTGGDSDINSKILEALESNGKLDQLAYRRLVLLALYNIGGTMAACKVGLGQIEKRVENLEENSIMLMARKHSKAAWIIFIGAIVLTVYALFHFGLFDWLLELLGIPPLPGVP